MLINSHQVLQLRETPLCTGADRAVIQNNLAGTAIQRADMRSIYQAGFVTEKKALVEFGERFIQGAAALVDRSHRMDGDAVRRSLRYKEFRESVRINPDRTF